MLIQIRAFPRGNVGKDLDKDSRQDPGEECFKRGNSKYEGLREEQ